MDELGSLWSAAHEYGRVSVSEYSSGWVQAWITPHPHHADKPSLNGMGHTPAEALAQAIEQLQAVGEQTVELARSCGL